MTETLYVNGVVIPCGIPDHEGDVLNKKDIKKIFTKYIDRDTDTMHTRIKNKGVNVLANWISEVDTVINGKTAPAGSWLATIQITNDEIIKSIKDGSIAGLSLGSVSDVALTQKYWFINKSINYKDLDDTEEVIPLFISFVDKPSNQFGLEIMDYNLYINKRVDENMVKEDVKEDMIPVSFVDKLLDKFAINKAETTKTETNKKQQKKKEEEEINKATDDITNKELLDQIGDKMEEAIVSAFKKLSDSRTSPAVKEPAINKAEQNKDDEEEDNKEEDNKKETKTDESKKEEKTGKKEEAVDINKRATVKTEPVENPNTTTSFYAKSGRDEFGCRIR